MNAIPRPQDFVPLAVKISGIPLVCPRCKSESELVDALVWTFERAGMPIHQCRCPACERPWRQIVVK